jgi:hypothetical protein
MMVTGVNLVDLMFVSGLHVRQPEAESRMPLNFLGKLMFPRLQPWQQKKQAKAVVWAVVFAFVFAAIVVVIMFFENSRR